MPCERTFRYRRRIVFQNRIEDHGGSIATKWQGTRRHFVEVRAEGEQIGAGFPIAAKKSPRPRRADLTIPYEQRKGNTESLDAISRSLAGSPPILS